MNVLQHKLPYICSLPGAKMDPNISVLPVSGSSILRDNSYFDDEDNSQIGQDNNPKGQLLKNVGVMQNLSNQNIVNKPMQPNQKNMMRVNRNESPEPGKGPILGAASADNNNLEAQRHESGDDGLANRQPMIQVIQNSANIKKNSGIIQSSESGKGSVFKQGYSIKGEV